MPKRNTRAATDAQIREIQTLISGLDRQFVTNLIFREEYDVEVKKQQEKIDKIVVTNRK